MEVKTDDGRRLAVDITGADDGMPVFLLHGTPGSRTGPKPRSSVLYRDRGATHLLRPSRVRWLHSPPGAQHRRRCAGRRLYRRRSRDSIGSRWSAGPVAVRTPLACAAPPAGPVARTLVLVSVAPSDANDLDWFQDMAVSNVDAYSTADADDRTAIVEWLTFRADRTRSDPESMINAIRKEMGDGDGRVLDDPAFRQLLTDTYVEAFRAGPDGWIDDVLAFRRPWASPSTPSPVRSGFWHGAGGRPLASGTQPLAGPADPQAIVDGPAGPFRISAPWRSCPGYCPGSPPGATTSSPPHRTDRPTERASERPAPAGRPHDREPARAAAPLTSPLRPEERTGRPEQRTRRLEKTAGRPENERPTREPRGPERCANQNGCGSSTRCRKSPDRRADTDEVPGAQPPFQPEQDVVAVHAGFVAAERLQDQRKVAEAAHGVRVVGPEHPGHHRRGGLDDLQRTLQIGRLRP